MDDRQLARGRALVIAGFAINVVAALVDLVNVYGSGTFRLLAFSGVLGIFLGVPIAVASLGAWWFLARLTLSSPEQRSLFGRAMYFFAAQALLVLAAQLNVAWHQRLANWSSSIIWLMALGAAVEAIGFVAVARVVAGHGDDLVGEG